MRTLPRVGVATVGYEGRTADELVAVLTAAAVDVLVDVRLTPISRKPGLSKGRLTSALAQAGIAYLHLPQLGNPRDTRDGYRNAEVRALARFRSLLRSNSARDALNDLVVLSEDRRVALLCFERDAKTCHRALVVEALSERRPDLAVTHL